MKRFILVSAAAILVLSGCAGQNGIPLASTDEAYTPIGTNIPRKTTSAQDVPTIVSKAALENDRNMGNTGPLPMTK